MDDKPNATRPDLPAPVDETTPAELKEWENEYENEYRGRPDDPDLQYERDDNQKY